MASKKNQGGVSSAVAAATEVLEATRIDPLALDDGFVKIASLLATYNERYYEALKTHLVAKAKVDRVYAQTYLSTREELNEVGEKATEAMIKSHVEANDNYFQARMAAVEAEAEKARLWGVLDALRAKKDALISLGANARAEMSGAPSIRGDRRAVRDVAANHSTDDEFSIEYEDMR
jgi:hypothetical protein